MPMTYTFDFNCAPEHLFTYLIDDEKMLKWMHGVTKIEPITDGPVAVGAKARMWIKEGRKEYEYQTEVTVYEPNKRIACDMTGGCFGGKTSMTPDYQLSASPSGGTTLVYSCAVNTSSMMFKIMEVLFRPMNKRMLKKMMATLKEQAEAPA